MYIEEKAREKKTLLAAHRGVCGGNIPCNSLQAFQIACRQGADIVELDVERSRDGELYVQHPGMEKVHLRMKDSIKNYGSSFVDQLYLSNGDMTATEWHIVRLETALSFLRGRAIVAIDKFAGNPEQIARLVRKLGMQDQVLVKTPDRPECVDAVETYAPDLPFMPIVKWVDRLFDTMAERNVNYLGSEVVFDSEDAPVAGREYIERMHRMGKLIWGNGILYDYREPLSAGHSDDVSMLDDPEKGWGWLADRGYDIIQTDFLLPCRLFLENTGRRRKV